MRIISLVTVAIFFTGCAQQIADIKQTVLEKAFAEHVSKWSPVISTTKKLQEYISLIASNNKKIVSDELGEYYHDLQSDILFRCVIYRKDGALLKNLFKKEKGLLTPIYVYTKDYTVDVDWKATENRYLMLTNIMKLELLPFEYTKKYHKILFELKEQYDAKIHKKILDKIGVKSGYLISSGGIEEDYYNNFRVNNKNVLNFSNDIESLEYALERMNTSIGLNFMPIGVIESSNSGYVYLESGCISINLELYGALLKYKEEQIFDFPTTKGGASADGLKSATKEHTKSKLIKLKNMYQKYYLTQYKMIDNINRSSNNAFYMLKVSRAIKSQALD